MRKLGFFLVPLAFIGTAHAEVYRCKDSGGRTQYQSTPCQNTNKSEALDIRFDPEKEAAAKAKLQAIQSEYDQRKQDQQKKQQEQTEQQQKQKTIELNRLEVSAQQRQADAAERQAQAMERQNQVYNQPYYVPAPVSQRYLPPPPNQYRPAVPPVARQNPGVAVAPRGVFNPASAGEFK